MKRKRINGKPYRKYKKDRISHTGGPNMKFEVKPIDKGRSLYAYHSFRANARVNNLIKQR